MTPNPGVKLRTTRDAQKEGPMTPTPTDTPPSALDAAEDWHPTGEEFADWNREANDRPRGADDWEHPLSLAGRILGVPQLRAQLAEARARNVETLVMIDDFQDQRDEARAQLAEARAERDGLAKIAAGYKLQLDVGFQHIERTLALSDDDKIKELRARVIELEDDLEAAVAVHEDNEAATADEHRQCEKHMADLAAAHSQVAALLAEREEMAGDLGHARQAYDGDQMWNDMAESWSARLRAPLKPKETTR